MPACFPLDKGDDIPRPQALPSHRACTEPLSHKSVNMPAVVHHSPIRAAPLLCQISAVSCSQGLCRSQRNRFCLRGGTSLPQDAEHSEQRLSFPLTPGALAKESPQKGVDSPLVYIAKPATRPNKPPVKVSQKAKMPPNRLELVPVLVDACEVHRNMRSQRPGIQALDSFEFGEQCFHARRL